MVCASTLLRDTDALCLCLGPKLRATSPPYLGLFESWIPAGICFKVGQCKMSHPAPFPGLGVGAGILLASGTPVTWDCCLKRAVVSRAVLVAVGRGRLLMWLC